MEKKRIRTFEQAVRKFIGKEYDELICSYGWVHYDVTDKLGEHLVHECDVCSSWECLETTGGNGEAWLCEHCFEHSQHEDAVAARQIYEELNAV